MIIKSRFYLNSQGIVIYPKMIHSQEVTMYTGVFAGGGMGIIKKLRTKQALKTAADSL